MIKTAEKLPKYARPKKPWQRQVGLDYSILDQVGSDKKRKPPTNPESEGNSTLSSEMKKQKTMTQIQPKAAVQAFNPYESVMNNNNNNNNNNNLSINNNNNNDINSDDNKESISTSIILCCYGTTNIFICYIC